MRTNVYLSSSWKNRERVRELAIELRKSGLHVYDFTNPECRKTPEIPPEKFPEQFDPETHVYREYLKKPAWRRAVIGNRNALDACDVCVLLLPCGIDATADWAYAVGRGKKTIVVGHPAAGERSPVHLWADYMVDFDADVVEMLGGTKV